MKEKKLSSKSWMGLFLSSILIFFGLFAGFNFVTDPYGAFGDHVLQWWSYDETKNPRVAKFQYLKQHHDEYDSYIVGCSGTSSYPVEQLNEYFDANFYNMIVYGADMLDSEQYCRYLIDNYEVKNIVLNVYLGNGMSYDTEDDKLAQSMPYQVSGTSALEYYKRYLFANPHYGIEKLKCLFRDSYMQQGYDIFDEETGAYDKSRRDIENISDMSSYLQTYPVFENYPMTHYELPETENCMNSVAAIREMCEDNGVNLVVVASPLYQDYAECFDPEDVTNFYSALAEVTPYWDFSSSTISQDPRYFYDESHFRNCVGKMALARMAGDTSVYVPDDFGEYVTQENVNEYLGKYWQQEQSNTESYTKKVPILMYHHLIEDGEIHNEDVMTVAQFRQHMEALTGAGYTAVTFDDLRAYVNKGIELPDKPVVITFDDGYDNNYELAFPILKEFNMKATIFVIGTSVGKDVYKETGKKMTPHFDWNEADEMENSGVIDIESHGYDIHEVPGLDADPIRDGCLQKEDESEKAYVEFLSGDCEKMQSLFENHLNKTPSVLAYPYGKYTELSEVIVAEEGFDITLSVESGNNILVKGIPQSMKAMKRHFIKDSTTPQALLEMIQN